MTSAQMKAKAKAAAAKNKAKSKMGSPNKKKGTAKPAAKAKNAKVYKRIKSTSTYKPKFEKVSDEKLELASPAKMSGRSYDMKMAYDKKLTPKARLHYLENERHDAPGKMKGSPYKKYGSPYHMGQKDSPNKFNKGLKQASTDGKLDNNPKFKAAVDASPAKMSNELKYGGPVIDQMKTLSQAGSSKVLKHMKSKI